MLGDALNAGYLHLDPTNTGLSPSCAAQGGISI
jgi:hypothetical protein